jgi:hypothetical protein
MPNAWFYYVCPLAICGVFVITGVNLLRRLVRGGKDAASRKATWGAGFGGILVLIIGGTVGGAMILTSPPPWERQRIFDHIFRTPPERITRFVVIHGTAPPAVIEDPGRIGRIAEILRAAPETSLSHPRSRWGALVEMHTRDGTYYFGVSATVHGDPNGTIVTPSYNPEGGGWNLGHFRADGLEKILEGAVSATGVP